MHGDQVLKAVIKLRSMRDNTSLSHFKTWPNFTRQRRFNFSTSLSTMNLSHKSWACPTNLKKAPKS